MSHSNNPKIHHRRSIKWAWDKLNGGIGNQVMESQEPYNDEVWMV